MLKMGTTLVGCSYQRIHGDLGGGIEDKCSFHILD